MFAIYQFSLGLLFWISFPILLPILLITGLHRRGLSERLGFYAGSEQPDEDAPGKRIWIHAASIGEVRAAKLIIERLQSEPGRYHFLVSTMTVHGRDFARKHLGAAIHCSLAPLDVPFAVNRALAFFHADIYVCLETELWPLLIGRLKRTGIPAVLINGRISDSSIPQYRRFAFLFTSALQSFSSIGAITEKDRQRFIEVGADPSRVAVTGNIKDAIRLPEDRKAVIELWHRTLGIAAGTDVFIGGSTHDPEEKLLLPLISRLIDQDWVVLVAPRHLNRLDSLESLLRSVGLGFDYLSDLKTGAQRLQSLIIVDTFGDLAELYSIARLAFIGGSLSGSGGHNLLEPAAWETVVFWGPDVADFRESADLLQRFGGGFMVQNVAELETKIDLLSADRNELYNRQKWAAQAAGQHTDGADRQAALILRCLGTST
ncbi:MAG: glycosyltransferase N-terminal domain-containing protein, partial [Desulfofustis sp.]